MILFGLQISFTKHSGASIHRHPILNSPCCFLLFPFLVHEFECSFFEWLACSILIDVLLWARGLSFFVFLLVLKKADFFSW